MSGPEGLLEEALDLVHHDLTRYVRFPSHEAADAVTLWIAATHCHRHWEHATRLVVKSPVKRCGKTRLAEVIRELVHRPLVTSNISGAVLVRSISESDPPTLILDEADTIFRKRAGNDQAEDLRGILNAGHSRGWPYLRWDVKGKKVEEWPTFAMACVAGIGDMPDTIEDRAVVVTMQRRAPGEELAEFRRRNIPSLRTLRTTLEHALHLSLDTYDSDDVPVLPVRDRAADCWEPLVAVAEAAGGPWPERARTACVALSSEFDPEEATTSERLLDDLRRVWLDEERHLPTAVILDRLCAIDEAPWSEWYGREFSARNLARFLRPYGIKSKNVKLPDGSVLKAYVRDEMGDAWSRYARDSDAPSATGATPLPNDERTSLTRGDAGSEQVADEGLGSATASDQEGQPIGSGVAEVAEGVPEDSCAWAERNLKAAGFDFQVVTERLPDPFRGSA